MIEDFGAFQISIARELGGISERLRSIDTHLSDNNKKYNELSLMVDKNKIELANIKTKLFIVVTAITLTAQFGPGAIQLFLRSVI